MRISTSQFFESTSATYQNNFSSVIKTQSQIDSGVRIQTAADDPVGAARLLQLQQQKDMLAQYSTNMNSIKSSLGAQEAVLDSINNSLQKASELALGAGSGKSDADRLAIANELGSIEEQVFSLLNSKDASGNYMFSGSKTDTPPYTRNNDGTYSYQGDDTQLNLKVSDTLTLASSDTARSIMEGATNTGRTQATFVPGVREALMVSALASSVKLRPATNASRSAAGTSLRLGVISKDTPCRLMLCEPSLVGSNTPFPGICEVMSSSSGLLVSLNWVLLINVSLYGWPSAKLLLNTALDVTRPADTESLPSLTVGSPLASTPGTKVAWVRPVLVAPSMMLLAVSLLARVRVSETLRLSWVSSP